MTDEEHSFRRAVAAAPKDPGPRLVYADWLDERGWEVDAEVQRVLSERPECEPEYNAETHLRFEPASRLTGRGAWVFFSRTLGRELLPLARLTGEGTLVFELDRDRLPASATQSAWVWPNQIWQTSQDFLNDLTRLTSLRYAVTGRHMLPSTNLEMQVAFRNVGQVLGMRPFPMRDDDPLWDDLMKAATAEARQRIKARDHVSAGM